MFGKVARQKSQHKISVLLKQRVFMPVAQGRCGDRKHRQDFAALDPQSLFQSARRLVMDLTPNPLHRLRMNALSNARYEYKFVRLGEGWTSARREARERYQDEVQEHARDGWRLVQIFAPGVGAYGAAKYYELILERELTN